MVVCISFYWVEARVCMTHEGAGVEGDITGMRIQESHSCEFIHLPV